MKKVLIIGGNSEIGHAIFQALDSFDCEVYKTTRDRRQISNNTFYLDLMDVEKFIINISFDVVILCAGLTKIQDCENHFERSEKINFLSQIELVEYFRQLNPKAHIIFLSSNAVFSGKNPKYQVTDIPDPSTVYGLHKYQTETHLQNLYKELTILRLTKVLSKNNVLLNSWLKALENQQFIYPYVDKFLAPIALNQVVDIVIGIVLKNIYGLFHVSGHEDISYYDLSMVFCKINLLNSSYVHAHQSSKNLEKIKYSSLANNCDDCGFKKHDFLISGVLNNIFLDTTCDASIISL